MATFQSLPPANLPLTGSEVLALNQQQGGNPVTVQAPVSALAGSFVNPMTSAGDIIIGGAYGAPERLGVGANGDTLTLVNGVPAWVTGGGAGTVTSVGLQAPSFLTVTGSPITSSGTLALGLATQNVGVVFAGPVSGSTAAPTFRALTGFDLQFIATNKFFKGEGAAISRLNDRVFIGGATANDGAYPNVQQDWLTQFQVAAGVPNGSIDGSQAASLTSNSSESGFGFIAGSRSSQMTNAGDAIGLASFALNNNPSYGTSAWAFYGEAHALESNAPYTYVAEFDIRATVPQAAPSPYTPSQSTGLLLAAGAGLSSTGQYSPTTALWIMPNLMPFQAAIVIGNNAVAGVSNNVGKAAAIQLGKGHQIQWFSASGTPTGNIFSSATQTTNIAEINFENNALYVQSQATGNTQFILSILDNAANAPQFESALTGNPVIIAATGSDTNIDLQLAPKGTGLVWIGPYTNSTVTPTGYLEVKDSTGTLRKIPCL